MCVFAHVCSAFLSSSSLLLRKRLVVCICLLMLLYVSSNTQMYFYLETGTYQTTACQRVHYAHNNVDKHNTSTILYRSWSTLPSLAEPCLPATRIVTSQVRSPNVFAHMACAISVNSFFSAGIRSVRVKSHSVYTERYRMKLNS